MNPENTPVDTADQPVHVELNPVIDEQPTTESGATLFNQSAEDTAPKKGSIAYKILSIVLLVTLIIVGFGVGFMISFGSCFKSDCSPAASGAPIWIPVATLFISVPLVKKAFKKY